VEVGVADEDRDLVTDQLVAAVGEDRRPIDKAFPLLLAAVSREPSDAAAVCVHAAEDRGATVTGWIKASAKRSRADLDNDAGAQEEVSAEPLGKGQLRALRANQMRNRPLPAQLERPGSNTG
jgi:hypothetical protein